MQNAVGGAGHDLHLSQEGGSHRLRSRMRGWTQGRLDPLGLVVGKEEAHLERKSHDMWGQGWCRPAQPLDLSCTKPEELGWGSGAYLCSRG